MRQGLLNRQAHQAHCLTPCAPVPSVVRQPVYHIDLRRPNVQAQGIAKDILSRQAQNIEGDPLQFLEVTEQYWKVGDVPGELSAVRLMRAAQCAQI